MNKTGWPDWYAVLDNELERLRKEHDEVFLVGQSMGGCLVLRLAEQHGTDISGLVLINPSVQTDDKRLVLLPVLSRLLPSFPGVANDIKKPGVDEHGYTRTPLKAAHSMLRASRSIVPDLPRITAPLLIFHSADDHVVDESSIPHITAKVSSRDVIERTLTESFHVATLDNDAPQIFQESAEFIARVTDT